MSVSTARFRRLTRNWLCGALVVWVILGLALNLNYGREPLGFALLQSLHAISGVFMLAGCIVAGAMGERENLLVALGFFAAGVVLFFASPPLQRLALRLEFQKVRPAYEAVVTSVQAGRPAPVGPMSDGANVRVDHGPPARVAFAWSAFGDNWNGVVYDPTEIVATAGGWGKPGQTFTASPRAQELFGGDLVGCTRLAPQWFHCGFT